MRSRDTPRWRWAPVVLVATLAACSSAPAEGPAAPAEVSTDIGQPAETGAPSGAGCNPCPIQGLFDPQGADNRAAYPVGGVTITLSADPVVSTTTAADGSWTLSVPGTANVVRAAGDGFLPAVTTVAFSLMADPGFTWPTNSVVEDEEHALYQKVFSATPDAGRGFVVVIAIGAEQGTRITIDRPHDGSYAMTPEIIGVRSETTLYHGSLFFLSVEPGAVAATATMASGEPCLAPAPVPVEAAGVTTIAVDCR